MATITKPEVGATLPNPYHGAPVGSTMEVQPACDLDKGQWLCITHNETFRNNFEKDGHIHRGSHQLAWICFAHGIEVP